MTDPAHIKKEKDACAPCLRISGLFTGEVMNMAGFVPKDKMSKKAQKELNSKRRVIWEVRPVTKTVESKKIYSRKRRARNREDADPGFAYAVWAAGCVRPAVCGRPRQKSGLPNGKKRLTDRGAPALS